MLYTPDHSALLYVLPTCANISQTDTLRTEVIACILTALNQKPMLAKVTSPAK